MFFLKRGSIGGDKLIIHFDEWPFPASHSRTEGPPKTYYVCRFLWKTCTFFWEFYISGGSSFASISVFFLMFLPRIFSNLFMFASFWHKMLSKGLQMWIQVSIFCVWSLKMLVVPLEKNNFNNNSRLKPSNWYLYKSYLILNFIQNNSKCYKFEMFIDYKVKQQRDK